MDGTQGASSDRSYPASSGRIRFSQSIHISTDGGVHLSYDVETPERVQQPVALASVAPLISGLEVLKPATSKRGGRRPNAGRKPVKKAKKARRK
jgi:hypothetical protein